MTPSLSGYPFESKNGDITNMIHASKGTISQICRRLKIKQALLLLLKKVSFSTDKVAETFKSISNKKSSSTVKIRNTRYFGKLNPVPDELAKILELETTAVSFLRIMKNNCNFSSANKVNKRTDNSFAITNDGDFVQVFHFFADVVNSVEKSIVRRINVSGMKHGNRNLMYQINNIFEDFDIIATDKIDRVCVCLNEKIIDLFIKYLIRCYFQMYQIK